MKGVTAFVTAASLLLIACSGRSNGDADGSVPLPEAYPRINTYPARYVVYDSLPVLLSVNSAVTPVAKPGRTPGLDITYPHYNATVYLTVIGDAVADFDQIWDARRARIDNNIGDMATSAIEITSRADSSFVTAIVQAKSATQTPVQLLAASRRHGIIVTATAFLHDKITATNLDSVAPAINAIADDMQRLASDLAVAPHNNKTSDK